MAEIKEMVSEHQRRCDEDLARAEPAVRQAEAALDTLNKVNELALCIVIEAPKTSGPSHAIAILYIYKKKKKFIASR